MPGTGSYTPLQVAAVIHSAVRQLQIENGEEDILPLWEDAGQGTQLDTLAAVLDAQSGISGEQAWERWAAVKRAAGWTYGPVKDSVAKTHPCLTVTYAEIPWRQHLKDSMLIAVVHLMSGAGT
jgi:hypothetical protein